MEVQERERRAISRELHDEVGQSLTALLMELGNLGAVAPGDAELRRHLESIRRLAESSVNVVRNMALLLPSSMLDDLGLVPALQWQARMKSPSAPACRASPVGRARYGGRAICPKSSRPASFTSCSPGGAQ